MPPDQHRSTLCDDVKCGGEWVRRAVEPRRQPGGVRLDLAQSPAGATCASPTPRPARFARCSKKRARRSSSRATAASTGATCPASNEAIWFSQRDNWGQLYLHDLQTGQAEAPDHERRRQRHAAAARRRDEPDALLPGRRHASAGAIPYFRHFYRVGMDGKTAQLLTPEDADHDVSLSPSGKYFVDNYSKPDVPPTSVLRDADRQGGAARSRRWTSAGCSPPAGSRRCRSR